MYLVYILILKFHMFGNKCMILQNRNAHYLVFSLFLITILSMLGCGGDGDGDDGDSGGGNLTNGTAIQAQSLLIRPTGSAQVTVPLESAPGCFGGLASFNVTVNFRYVNGLNQSFIGKKPLVVKCP